ncbi:MAG: matrixin family metalloprotease [Planctomycetota bacterium]|jgi:hypothetical protein
MMKKIVGSILGVVLFFGVTSPALAAKEKASSAEVAKVTFSHYEIAVQQAPPAWDDTQDDFRLIANGVKWADTISYEVNPEGSGLSEAVVLGALEAGSEAWDDESSFDLFASPVPTDSNSIGRDETNRVVWNALNPGVIAVTHLWYSPRTKEMVEFDMEFNTYYQWSTDGDSNSMDLQNIATHELGHNGLSDLRPPKDQELTMYAYSGLGETKKRSLGTGDILGIQKLYGE